MFVPYRTGLPYPEDKARRIRRVGGELEMFSQQTLYVTVLLHVESYILRDSKSCMDIMVYIYSLQLCMRRKKIKRDRENRINRRKENEIATLAKLRFFLLVLRKLTNELENLFLTC